MTGILLLFLGCGGEEPECSEAVACGFGETCVEGVCKGQACATSAQCGMEQFCDAGSCVAGCRDDEDCYPGDACDTETAACTAALCADSRADCAYGQFCNTLTGECYDAGGYYCRSCVNEEDCGGNGNLCLDLGYSGSNFCGVTCTYESDCPGGYTCAGVTDLSGNVYAYQCITYCWLYDSGRSAPPAAPTQPPPGTVRQAGGGL